MELTKGLMKTKDLAEWFGITYGSFRNSSKEKYEILKSYADYEKVRGGVQINRVIFPIYLKSVKKDSSIIGKILTEIYYNDNLFSAAGIARRILLEEGIESDAELEEKTTRWLRGIIKEILGPRLEKEQDRNVFEGLLDGEYGWRVRKTAIRESEYNEHRRLTDEEYKLYKEIKDRIYEKNKADVEITLENAHSYSMGEIDEETFLKVDKKYNPFKKVMAEFKSKTGLQLVSIAEGHLNEQGLYIAQNIGWEEVSEIIKKKFT